MTESANAKKLSISIPAVLAKKLKKAVGARGVSNFAARAIRHELEREELGAFLVELESGLGPVPEQLVSEAKKLWRRS